MLSVWHVHTGHSVPSMRAGTVSALVTVFQHQGLPAENWPYVIIGRINKRMSVYYDYGLWGEGEACALILLPSKHSFVGGDVAWSRGRSTGLGSSCSVWYSHLTTLPS